MANCGIIIHTFIVTALWDVVLRVMAENYARLPPSIQEHQFIKYLIPYFKNHTVLAAALIAGFVGATTQYIILYLYRFPTNLKDIYNILKFMLVSFVVSGLYGFIMKASKLFPHLEATYYKELGHLGGAYHDGISGLIVQATLLFLYHIKHLL